MRVKYHTRPGDPRGCYHCYHVVKNRQQANDSGLPIGATVCCKCPSASWYEEEVIPHPSEVF